MLLFTLKMSSFSIFFTSWWWWPYSIFGVNATIAAFNEIYEDHNPYVVAFREQRESFGYNRTTAMYGWTDAYYFPAAKSEMLYEVSTP